MPNLFTACLECGGNVEDWQDWSCHPIHQRWHILQDLGEGAFANTVLARNISTGRLAALKVVFLESPDMDDAHRQVMLAEPDFLRAVEKSPNVVSCLGVEQDERQMVIVLEYLAGGQLLDHLHELGGGVKIAQHHGNTPSLYTEQHASQLFEQVMKGVAALHAAGIIHRDIKGENVLYARPRDGQGNGTTPRVVLIDLGMGCRVDKGLKEKEALGSPGFVAPEVALGGPHTPAMDIYSCGVLLFIMLVGRKPFNFSQCQELEYALLSLSKAPGLLDPRWRALSPAAKDLLMGMLRFDPAKRLTAAQVLKHDWVVSRGGLLPRPLDASVAYGAANVQSLRRLKNIVHSVIAAQTVYGDTMKRLERARDAGMLDRAASKIAAKSFARLHDAGGAVDPNGLDVSIRGGGERLPHQLGPRSRSVHGGGSMRAGGSVRGLMRSSMRASDRSSSLKKAASALALNDLVRQSLSSRGEGTSRRGSVYFATEDSVSSRRADVVEEEVATAKPGQEELEPLQETLQEKAQRASCEWHGGPESPGKVRGGNLFQAKEGVQ